MNNALVGQRVGQGELSVVPEKAHRVLRAAAGEAHGRTGTYVTMTPMMN